MHCPQGGRRDRHRAEAIHHAALDVSRDHGHRVADPERHSSYEQPGERRPLWEDYFDSSPVDAFEFGLQRVLDGIEALLSAR
jgi:hypothetical protein